MKKGTLGETYEALRKETGGHYAVKIIKKETIATLGLSQVPKPEWEVVSPFVTEVESVFEEGDCLYAVSEFVEGSTLFEELKTRIKMPEDVARFFIAEVIVALEELHRRKIV